MENRIEFTKKEAERFFKEFKEHKKCATFKELSSILTIPYGRLRLYMHAKRTIPLTLMYQWKNNFKFDYKNFKFQMIDTENFYKNCGYKAASLMKKKYGKRWNVILGRRGRKSLEKRLNNEPVLNKKWRKSIENSLKEKFGNECYRIMGKRSIKTLTRKYGKNYLHLRGLELSKQFPKSISKKFEFNGRYFKSIKEIEIAQILNKNKMPFTYEQQILGFFPNFTLIDNKTIIEVVGFEWKPHIERTLNKIKKLKENNYSVIIYTYPNMIKYFRSLKVPILTQQKDLIKEVGYIRAK